jgi:hypothetical protein
MSNDEKIHETENLKETGDVKEEGGEGDNEFKLTVRKLEMPVRPRGVLAE